MRARRVTAPVTVRAVLATNGATWLPDGLAGPGSERPAPSAYDAPPAWRSALQRYKERAARHERSSDWRRGGAASPDPALEISRAAPLLQPLATGVRLISGSHHMTTSTLAPRSATQAVHLAEAFRRVRAQTEALAQPLVTEDYVVQSMPDCSPTKWHLAHVSWFFETFILTPNVPNYTSLHPQYAYLFNSYYNAVADRPPPPKRAHIPRPTVPDTYRYRAYVDEHMLDLLETSEPDAVERLAPLITLGLHHEQQHQELIV